MFSLKLKCSSYFSDPLLKHVKHLCENLNENYYFAINELNQIVTIKNQTANLVYDLNQNDSVIQQSKLLDVNLIAFGHLPDQELICLIYENGTICTLDLNSKQIDKIQLDYEFVTAEFSPEYDKIALTTKTSKLVLLNCFFEEINTSELNDQKQGAVDVLNVGWGKKETQFHGSDGKQSRTIKKEILTCVKFDDLKPRITWRDDGVYFATSVVDSNKSIRKIRIYDNDGILQQTSDEHSGLEYLLNWKPNGNLITSSISLTTGHYFVFFEKNGQRFDEFRLPYKKDEFELQQIVWSNVADCVVILGKEHSNNLEQQSQSNLEQKQVVLIYSMKNFYWYCQQKLIFTKKQIKKIINQNQLTTEFEPLNLFVLFDDGKVGEFVYLNQVNVNADADCAVIDGKSLLFTPFSHSSIPPPMYGYALKFNVEINEVCFSKPKGKFLLVKLSDQTIHLIERSEKVELDSSIDLVFQSISFEQSNIPQIYASSKISFRLDDLFNNEFKLSLENDLYQFNLTDQKVCYALSNRKKNELIRIDLKNNRSNALIDLNESIQLIHLSCYQSLIIVDKNGLVWKLNDSSNGTLDDSSNHCSSILQPFGKMNYETNQLEQVAFKIPAESIVKLELQKFQYQEYTITLCNNYNLYINHLPLQANDCNSFLVHNSNILMYTTNDHKLRSIWQQDIFHHLIMFNMQKNNDEANDFRFVKEEETVHDKATTNVDDKSSDKIKPVDRAVERGSRLITSTSDCKLIIQMPRGNLETITPRLLVLDQIKQFLNNLSYRSAFQLMKKHRINLNLLVDNDLKLFIKNVTNFIRQISETNTTDLCLFLSELSEDNVLEILYSNYNLKKSNFGQNSKSLFDLKFPELKANHFSNSSHSNDSLQSKLNCVSKSMRNAMIQLNDEKKYFIPIILTYLKQTKPSIGLALEKIYHQPDKELRANALNYLKYIIEMHVLIKEALATYDLNIAKLVYSISNLDPKEYLQLLAKLEAYKLPEYQKYQIDLHLKNYDKALENLIECKPFSDYVDEIIELIKQKNLYKIAIELLSKRSDCNQYLKQIYSLYGDYLLVKKYFNEALIVYKKGDNFSNAIKAAQLANNWNQIIECASLNYKHAVNNSNANNDDRQTAKDNLNKIFKSIADQLDNSKDAKDSSFIYGFYLNDWYEAIKVLIKNYFWADAYRLLNDFSNGSKSKHVFSENFDRSENDEIQINLHDKTVNGLNNKSENESSEISLSQNQLKELVDLADKNLKINYDEIIDKLNESFEELKKYTERLQIVRANKLNLIQQLNLVNNLNDLEDEFLNDDQSTISTVNSLQSAKQRNIKRNLSNQSQANSLSTNKSNKNKKDQTNKRYRLKEGGLNEDLALIYHIKLRIKKIENLKSTIKLLITTLINRNFDKLASELQTMFDQMLDVVQFVIMVVWKDQEQKLNEFLSTHQNEIVNVIQDVELREPPKLNVNDVDWKLILN